jgi:isoprene-epoxide---glutathione S-transferase
MAVKLYGYIPAWGLPCISPYVTKAAVYMTMTNTPFEFVNQDLTRLDDDAPAGKLPYIVDDDGTKVHDSQRIVEHLRSSRGHTIDDNLSAEEHAIGLAFTRLTDENLYWSGVIQPRWRMDEGFNVYVPYIVGMGDKSYDEVWPALPEGLQEMLVAFRQRVLDGFNGQGMGRRTDEEVFEFYKDDIDALSDFIGTKSFLLGEQPSSYDAAIYSEIRHCMDHPQQWAGTGYIESKGNLKPYADRFRSEFGV